MFGSGAENHFLMFAQKVSLHTNETRQCSKANTVEFWVFLVCACRSNCYFAG